MKNFNITAMGSLVVKGLRVMNAMYPTKFSDARNIGTCVDKNGTSYDVEVAFQAPKNAKALERIHYFLKNDDKLIGIYTGLINTEYIDLIFGGIDGAYRGKGLAKAFAQTVFDVAKTDTEIRNKLSGKYFSVGLYTAPIAQHIGKQLFTYAEDDVNLYICESVADISESNKYTTIEDLDKVVENPKNRIFIGMKQDS